ncbi:LacOPZ-alpha peptide from pUC9 [Cryptosporidium hominis TU502]|uniref:LacOPZ-alpha peptide from pUC9 n=1 Tax=Cryptosporidium hominis (strain TU502) TaxID=353151 RepID=UPI0000452AA8|nr:LacOPZ-alpha peptide from pUC9 [Cryptosporidium hominis TU502]
MNYCKDDEIKDILLPLLIFNNQNGCQFNHDKNILNIFNSCCDFNGWIKMYSSLSNLDKDIISTLGIEFLQPGGSTSSRAAATAVELQLLFPLVRVNFELGVIMVIAVSCVKLLSAHNSTQHTSRKHKV